MDSAPLLCPNPNVPSPSQQAGSMSIWSYMTAAIVASTVASNMVNNVSLGCKKLIRDHPYITTAHFWIFLTLPPTFKVINHHKYSTEHQQNW